MTNHTIRDHVAALADNVAYLLDCIRDGGSDPATLQECADRANAARDLLAAEPGGEGPSHREICHWLEQQAHWGENIRLTPRIANMIQDALSRWGRPAAPPALETTQPIQEYSNG